jgi:hypothetical protein
VNLGFHCSFPRVLAYRNYFLRLVFIDLLGLLTYMSMRREWARLVREGEQLFVLDPFPGDPKARTLLMTREIRAVIAGPWNSELMEERCGRLLARLHRIVRGELLSVCMTPFKARHAELGRLDPTKDSVFDIRSNEKPGLRVFCRFAEKDVLIAFSCAPRSVKVSWMDKLPLGNRHSREWKRGVFECKQKWAELFPEYEPVKGDCLDDYLSNAVLERA